MCTCTGWYFFLAIGKGGGGQETGTAEGVPCTLQQNCCYQEETGWFNGNAPDCNTTVPGSNRTPLQSTQTLSIPG